MTESGGRREGQTDLPLGSAHRAGEPAQHDHGQEPGQEPGPEPGPEPGTAEEAFRSGVAVVAAPPVSNVAQLVRLSGEARGEQPALVAEDASLSWAELDTLVDRMAGSLRTAGVRPLDRVAIVLGTTINFAVCYFGVLRAGGVAVPVNTALTPGELARVIADSGAAVVIVGQARADAVRDAMATPSTGSPGAANEEPPAANALIVVDAGVLRSGERALSEFVAPDPASPESSSRVDPVTGGEDLAVLLYTSGTSGVPRAAMLSHRALLANLEQVLALDASAMLPTDRVLGVLPLFHVYGLNAVLGMAARTGACVVLSERFDPKHTLQLVRAQSVTLVPAAPPLLTAWSSMDGLSQSLATVRLIVSGSAALPVTLVEQIQTATGLRVHEGYGLTEAAPIVASTLASQSPPLGSVGRALPGVEVRLVDEQFQAPEEGDAAEIAIRGANLFSGYWPDASNGPDEHGWWRTGDVAYQDGDGNLTLVDRVRDLVIVSGFNVYPREVEDVLRAMDRIAEAAVVPVPHPYTGEAVKAFVVPRPGSELTVEEILAHCRQRLARFKCPTIVSIVDALPHTATGKIAKGRLRSGPPRPGSPA